MAFKLSENSSRLALASTKQPHLILEMDGLTKVISTDAVLELIRIGDEGLLIGDDWAIGGLREVLSQESILSFTGSTTMLSQQIDIDKGRGTSITSMALSMIDKANVASEIVSPGVLVDEILSRRARVYLGFVGASFPEDYIIIFRGIVGDVESGPGKVTITVQSPETKKRQKLFLPKDTILTSSIDDSVTTIPVETTDGFLDPMNGPGGVPDESLKFYIKIEDEIIRYTSIDATNFLGCTRAQLGTTAAAHDDEAQADSYFTLEGNAIDLALKMMLSGVNGNYLEDLSIASFNNISTLGIIENSLYIRDVDLVAKYNVQIGDYVTIEDSLEASNNISGKRIAGIGFVNGGTYLEIEDVAFTTELESIGKLNIRSQYDTLGYGLAMYPDEVDINQHLDIKSRFLSSFEYKFYIKEEIENAKEFIEEQIYMPASCFSLPRKAQSSLGILTPPYPGEETIVLDETNILNASQIKIRRSLNKNFLNTVIYKFDEDALEDEKFRKSFVNIDQDSRERIRDRGNVVFDVKSKGLRSTLNALNLATQAANRRMNTYKFAAEFLEGVQVSYGVGYTAEVGDIIILDAKSLQVTNFGDGTRVKEPTLFIVINKRMDIVKGDVKLDLLNSGYGVEQVSRYGLIGPASLVKTSIDNQRIVVKPSFTKDYGTNEGLKWLRYPNCPVIIRSQDYSVYESAVITSVSFNELTLDHALAFTPTEDYIVELDTYNLESEIIKLKYTFMTDEATFDDGKNPYTML